MLTLNSYMNNDLVPDRIGTDYVFNHAFTPRRQSFLLFLSFSGILYTVVEPPVHSSITPPIFLLLGTVLLNMLILIFDCYKTYLNVRSLYSNLLFYNHRTLLTVTDKTLLNVLHSIFSSLSEYWSLLSFTFISV